ncbi:hypothetical protein NL676_029372 [Syzygium grande]|nr:hypothetical protein NL676_029372 [Syzygium grande]
MVAFSSALSGNEMKKRRKYQRLEKEKISLPDGKSSKVSKIKRILKWQLKIEMSNKLLKRIRDAYVRKMVRFAGCCPNEQRWQSVPEIFRRLPIQTGPETYGDPHLEVFICMPSIRQNQEPIHMIMLCSACYRVSHVPFG